MEPLLSQMNCSILNSNFDVKKIADCLELHELQTFSSKRFPLLVITVLKVSSNAGQVFTSSQTLYDTHGTVTFLDTHVRCLY